MEPVELIETLVAAEIPVVISTIPVGRVEVSLGHPQSRVAFISVHSVREAFEWLNVMARQKYPKAFAD